MDTTVTLVGESRTDLALAVMLGVIVGGQLLLTALKKVKRDAKPRR